MKTFYIIYIIFLFYILYYLFYIFYIIIFTFTLHISGIYKYNYMAASILAFTSKSEITMFP